LNSAGTNPTSVRDAGSFHVQTYAIVGGSDYAIDDTSFTTVFTPTVEALTASVSPDSDIAYDTGATYTFDITPETTIDIGGSLKIVFPTEVYAASLSACVVTIASNVVTP